MSKGSWSRMEFKEASWLRSLQFVGLSLQERLDGQFVDVPQEVRRVIRDLRKLEVIESVRKS